MSTRKLHKENASTSKSVSTSDLTAGKRKVSSLKKEYIRFCRLYSCEPLEIVCAPLERASLTPTGCDLRVDLKGKGLRGVDCIALGKMMGTDAPISQLILSDCLLLPQGFKALLDGLSKSTKIRSLDLRGNNIQKDMILALSKLLRLNESLFQLTLEWNALGESKEHFASFCDALALNVSLQRLDLRNNQIAPESGVLLANAVKGHKKLETLDLRWNNIGLEGAKALWSALQTNHIIRDVQLEGNFITEEVVLYIENHLRQRADRKAEHEAFEQKTKVLARQLENTEKRYKEEIQAMVTVYDTDNLELRKLLEENHKQVVELDDELHNEELQRLQLEKEVSTLKNKLQHAARSEDLSKEAFRLQEIHLHESQELLKGEMLRQKGEYEEKLKMLREELCSMAQERGHETGQVNQLSLQLNEAESNVTDLKERIEVMKKQAADTKALFEARIQGEKEKWANWKSEAETAEQEQIITLQREIGIIQATMMDQIRKLQQEKQDLELECKNLRIEIAQGKVKAEESLASLRLTMLAEEEKTLSNYTSQLDQCKRNNGALEVELQKKDSQMLQMNNEIQNLNRHNDSLRQQLSVVTQELADQDTAVHNALSRAKAELKEHSESFEKEEEANRALRAEVIQLQEKLATLTLVTSRELQDKTSEVEHWKTQVERRNMELVRLKEEDMHRAGLLHEAFSAYLRSTSAATGIPLQTENEQVSAKTRGHPMDGGDSVNIPAPFTSFRQPMSDESKRQ